MRLKVIRLQIYVRLLLNQFINIINIFQNKIFIQLNKRSLWRSCNISYLKCIRIIFCPITRCLKVKRLLKFAVLCTMCKPYKFVSFPVNHSSVALKIKAWPSILCVYPGIWKCLYSFCFIYRFSVSNIIKSIQLRDNFFQVLVFMINGIKLLL